MMIKEGYTLSKRDYARLQAMLTWFEKQRKIQPLRRRKAMGGGAAVANTIFGIVLRGLQYADPDGKPPEGISQYIIALKSDNLQLWDPDTDYTVGQKCYINETVDDVVTPKIYRAIEDNNNSSPPGSCWEEEDPISPKGLCLEADGYGVTCTDLRNTARWYYPQDEVPLIMKDGGYYFADPVIPLVNTGKQCSIRWNDDEQRLMAVYR